MSDDFVSDLERGLTAAARRHAARRRPALRRPPLVRLLVAGVVAIGLIVAVAILARAGGGGGERAGDERPVPPPGGTTVPLLASLPPARCRDLPVAQERAGLDDLAVLRRTQHEPDAIPPPQGNEITWLPVRSFDGRDPRRALAQPTVHVVPSRGVPEGRRCATDEGPGYCLAEASSHFRCFSHAALARGEVLMRLSSGQVAGLVPDGITAVTVGGVTADVTDNAYLAAVPAGADTITLVMHGEPGCAHGLSQALADRLPLLDSPYDEPLPAAGVALTREWEWQFDAIDVDGAVPWGEGDGLAVWLVPVVSRDAPGRCAPADGACVVALPDDGEADASCRAPLQSDIRSVPLAGGRTMVYGIVDRDVTGMRLRDGMGEAKPEAVLAARHGVVGGVVPFDGDGQPFLEPVRAEPITVAVVDATSGTDDATTMRRRLEDAGYTVRPGTIPGVTPQEPTCVHWRDRAHADEAAALAELIGADGARIIDDRTPGPVVEADADVVVQVGSAPVPPAPEGQRRPSC